MQLFQIESDVRQDPARLQVVTLGASLVCRRAATKPAGQQLNCVREKLRSSGISVRIDIANHS